ncbi:MAG: 3-hydroxy-3-methylglutaryl-CoA reductase [Candidatus Eisenbacteria bacterium]|uniref:hydroxymethylglutaryl-CoA reductase (NADPH) n=1 Tax=Eiseniibacteriota bacterium TaxID=2212470 RepID=A0A538UC74_UNCEI|nr:MAG: 3-hydroxy-3-methylglutaryl-CoA reductase [Candidatus Eisenbacteria bacterium]
MPVSKDLAREVIRRLTQHGSLDVLAQRLAPRSPDETPLPSDVPRPSDWSEEARAQRIAFFEARGIELPHLDGRGARVDPETLRGNIEQYIGMTQVPTGVIGPLRVNGMHAHGDYYVPLATTEGTLVASYHRGARLASRAGGIAALVTTEQVQRAPGFVFESLANAAVFAAWAMTQFEHLAEVAASRTSHGRLIDLLAHVEANHVYLILAYHTADAAGQNMVTFCSQAVCEAILAESPVKPVSWFLEANMSGDKKATVLSFLQTRGRHVMAEVTLPRRLVERGLHTTPDRMAEYWRMSFVGGAQSGSIGVSGHVANGIAALFLACGQDVACVSEASVGITRLELTAGGDLHCAVTLPNLIVGTIGGGTRMPTARECLRILRCEGAVEDMQQAGKFAEIAAAVALAGEISIVGAICAGEFSGAHQRLGRAPAG